MRLSGYIILLLAVIPVTSSLDTSVQASADGDDVTGWYTPARENKPFLRWWWHGSAVDREGLTHNLEEFAKAGVGGVEVTPIYGVQGNEANEMDFLSEEWMSMYNFLLDEAGRLDLQVDMNCGTGWPFGGPEITRKYAAKKMAVTSTQSDTAHLTVESVPTGQKVKRAAPGGEGFVLDHYYSDALELYLGKFEKAFKDTRMPDTWFCDSYEVYEADWTDGFEKTFRERYGYDITQRIMDTSSPDYGRVLCDYRECLGDMLKDNFYKPWMAWAHSHESGVRNQSHGAPANILDLYALADIPECETYGRTRFNIPGLRQDPLLKDNDGDPAALKFAASAAHLTGRQYCSAEVFTWLTEHFRTSLSQCKPELDRAFCAGVNHVYIHGATYSPKGAEFPGRLFYASVNMSPGSNLWKDAPEMFKYIERCQTFLSAGEPDPDFLLYVPVHDVWSRVTDKPYMMFDIHHMDKTLPEVKQMMNKIQDFGFDADYISDSLLQTVKIDKPIIIPACHYMPSGTVEKLQKLIDQGHKLYFIDRLPQDVPGLSRLDERRKLFSETISRLPEPVSLDEVFQQYKEEPFKTKFGGSLIRRRNECGGYNYFLAMLNDSAIDGWVTLATDAVSAMIFDPLRGECGKAEIRHNAGCQEDKEGCCKIRLQLQSGESLMIKTFTYDVCAEPWHYVSTYGESKTPQGDWMLSFPESIPAIKDTFFISAPSDWTKLEIPEAKLNFASACYQTEVTLPTGLDADDWILDLGDVRESARVRINGHYAGTVWCVPFKLKIGRYLHEGVNDISIEVTNLPSNRIADMDRKGQKWRVFKDANIATIDGRKGDYSGWSVDPSGLCSPVILIPVKY